MRKKRTLFILDGLEALQFPLGTRDGQLRDPAVQDLIVWLAVENPGLCVITTRQSVPELASYRQTTAPQIELKNLSERAGIDLLK